MHFIKKSFVFLFFSIWSLFVIFSNDGLRYDFLVLLSFFLIVSFSFWNIFSSRSVGFSLRLIFYLFSVFFFGIAPALQYKFNVSIWSNIFFTEENYLKFNFLVIVILIVFELLYRYYYKRQIKVFDYISSYNQAKLIREDPVKMIIISIISFFIFSYSKNFNFLLIFFRGIDIGFVEEAAISSSALSLIIDIFVRPIPLICLVVFLHNNPYRFRSFHFWILVILSLVSNSPTGMPRFQAAALYIPVVLSFSSFFKKPLNFSILLCFGLMILFPILNQFRRLSSYKINLSSNSSMFLEAHFDSYQNFLHVVITDYVTYGRQLLGVFLFFVPRSFWLEKPIGSGAFFSNEMGYVFSNISMNFFGEGYINFGLMGVLIFLAILIYLTSYLDFKFWNVSNSISFNINYMFFLGMLFFVLRGDLLSSFAYSMGLFFSTKFVVLFIKK